MTTSWYIARIPRPRFVVDQHIAFFALFLLLLLEVILIVLKVKLYYAAVAA